MAGEKKADAQDFHTRLAVSEQVLSGLSNHGNLLVNVDEPRHINALYGDILKLRGDGDSSIGSLNLVRMDGSSVMYGETMEYIKRLEIESAIEDLVNNYPVAANDEDERQPAIMPPKLLVVQAIFARSKTGEGTPEIRQLIIECMEDPEILVLGIGTKAIRTLGSNSIQMAGVEIPIVDCLDINEDGYLEEIESTNPEELAEVLGGLAVGSVEELFSNFKYSMLVDDKGHIRNDSRRENRTRISRGKNTKAKTDKPGFVVPMGNTRLP